MNYLQAIILSVIEGITEFLPISSTGHMIIASSWMGIAEDQFVKNFEVIIQFGAILSVLLIYWKKFLPQYKSNWNFYLKLAVAFLPAAIIGFLLKNKIDELLGSVLVVAWSLILGGIVLIWSDSAFKHLHMSGKTTDELSFIDSFKLGVFQCFALCPGVSRSGATILGGLALGMNKKEAAEFSFFLAVPTLAAATAYKLLKIYPTIDRNQIDILILGTVISFFVALLAIKTFINLVGKYGFKYFGYYRIILGLIILFINQKNNPGGLQ